jgi:broad specificity phosphatase PhoE
MSGGSFNYLYLFSDRVEFPSEDFAQMLSHLRENGFGDVADKLRDELEQEFERFRAAWGSHAELIRAVEWHASFDTTLDDLAREVDEWRKKR